MKKTLLTLALATAFIGAQAQSLRSAYRATPIPYYDEFEKGYVILRDGTELKGVIDIKKLEDDGEIKFESTSGEKYKLQVKSLIEWGLNLHVPTNYSPLTYYDWKNNKRKENKDPERGFVELKNGEIKEGKIKLEGWSSESYLAKNDFFALEQLTLIDENGKEKTYQRDEIAGFGRIRPWEFAPSHVFMSQATEAFGKRKTKKLDGYAIMHDGSKIEGEMQLVVINSMNSNSLTDSDLVDEIYFKRDGKDEKIDMDDVFAYGVKNLTINDITNNGDIQYTVEEMNFHPGSVTTKTGKTLDGLVAYFPEIGNYYGVYVAESVNDNVDIIALKDIEHVEQQIDEIAAFEGYGSTAKSNKNSNINGYIVTRAGKKVEGTIEIVGDNGWYVSSINFINAANKQSTLGGDGTPISYFVKDGNMYVQNVDVFVKAKSDSQPLVLYDNPYIDKSGSFGNMLLQGMVTQLGSELGAEATRGVWAAQAKSGNLNSPDLGMNIGSLIASQSSLLAGKIGKPSDTPEREAGEYNFFNKDTGEWARADKDNWQILLGGCLDYLKSDDQKTIKKYSDEQLVAYVNTCYSK